MPSNAKKKQRGYDTYTRGVLCNIAAAAVTRYLILVGTVCRTSSPLACIPLRRQGRVGACMHSSLKKHTHTYTHAAVTSHCSSNRIPGICQAWCDTSIVHSTLVRGVQVLFIRVVYKISDIVAVYLEVLEWCKFFRQF